MVATMTNAYRQPIAIVTLCDDHTAAQSYLVTGRITPDSPWPTRCARPGAPGEPGAPGARRRPRVALGAPKRGAVRPGHPPGGFVGKGTHLVGSRRDAPPT